MSMASFGIVYICFVVELMRAVTLGWSIAFGTNPVCILKLLW